MRKKKKVLLLMLCVAGFAASCTTEDNLLVEKESLEDISNFDPANLTAQTVVVKERDPKYPLEFPVRKTRALLTPYAALSEADYLGCSYKLDVFPLGTSENIGCPVIDIEKLEEEEPFYVLEKNIGTQTANYFSYANLDRYSNKSKDSSKVNSGFDLDLGLFSLGNKNTLTSIYSSNIENETNRVYGELDVNVLAKNYTLSASSNFLNKVKLNYLNSTFRDELYSITMKDFIDLYGALVLTDFYTGGRVSVIYSGLHNATKTVEEIERDVDSSISASFGNKGNGSSGNGNFGIGSEYGSETSMSNDITNFMMSVKAVGGKLSLPAFSAPKDFSQVDIDLSSWMNSMSEDTYRMVDIKDGGLRPLSDFVLEENLKRPICSYLRGTVLFPLEDLLVEPGIYIMIEPNEEFINLPKVGLTTALLTKRNDIIILDYISNIPEADVQKYVQEIVDEKSKKYGMKISTFTFLKSEDGLALLLQMIFLGTKTYPAYLDDDSLAKYVDDENNTMYLLYDGKEAIVNESLQESDPLTSFSNLSSVYPEIPQEHYYRIDENGIHRSLYNKGKYGLTIYDYKRTLNLYGMTDFVESLPTIEIDKEELLDYTLYAL